MAITFVNAGAVIDTGTGSSTLGYPASIATNDTLLVFGFQRASANTINAPSSTLTWTSQANIGVGMAVWSALYDGSATAPTVNLGGSNGFYVMLAYRGVDTTTPVGASSTQMGVTQANMRYAALTVPTDNMAVITFCKAISTSSGVAPATNFTEIIDDVRSTSPTFTAHIQHWIQTTATNLIQTDLTVTGGSSVTQLGIAFALTEGGASGGVMRSRSGSFNELNGGFR